MTIIYRSPNSEKEFTEYFSFRWELLRKPLRLERGSEKDQLEDSAFHIAAFNNKEIIGVGRFQIEKDTTARIRYMAVDHKFRKQGIGSNVLSALEEQAIENKIQTCWLLAREEALQFYLKNNYEVKGEAASDLEIPHQRMQKIL